MDYRFILTGIIAVALSFVIGVMLYGGTESPISVGGTIGSDVYQDVSFQGATAVTYWTVNDQPGTTYALQAYEAGSYVFSTSSVATTTLPAAKRV